MNEIVQKVESEGVKGYRNGEDKEINEPVCGVQRVGLLLNLDNTIF